MLIKLQMICEGYEFIFHCDVVIRHCHNMVNSQIFTCMLVAPAPHPHCYHRCTCKLVT